MEADESNGWLRFNEAPSHSEPGIGSRGLSAAVVEDGVVFTVTKDGSPTSCTISFEDYDLLLYFVEREREQRKNDGELE